MKHLALPIRVTASGALATVDQDGAEDVAQSAALLLNTRPGERRSVPDYGLPDPLFGQLDISDVVERITTWEPRADLADAEQMAAGALAQLQIHADSTGPDGLEPVADTEGD